MLRWSWLLLVTGCFVEKKQDAPDFVCEAVPPPSEAPERVIVRGVVKDLQGDGVLDNVQVQGFASGRPLDVVTTDANGEFEFSHETGGVPNNDSVSASRGMDFLPTEAYPGAPIFSDSFVEVRMLDMATVTELAMSSGVDVDFTKGTALVRVTDCNETPVAGGKIDQPFPEAVDPPSIYYFRFAAPDVNATETDTSGLVLITKLPATTPPQQRAKVTLTGTIGDVTLRPNEIETIQQGFVQTLARP